MESQLRGKKLLVLGGKPLNTYEIVKYAKSQGIYTIVTDYLPIEKSKSKQIADESWDISTAEVDVLVNKVEELSIDGVYTGVHEFNVSKVMDICSRTHRPFYATKKQWEICTDKALFKQTCKDFGLPIAADYTYAQKENIKFPVIVKPVDGSSGAGISICKNQEELDGAYELAMQCSDKKEVIIEEYLYGDEIVVFYTIINGIAKLSVMTDYYYNYDQEQTMPLPQVYMYPSIYLDEYMNSMDGIVKKYIQGIGIKNGTFFLQAFKNERGFFFFEPGLRPGGSSVYKYTELLNGISYIDMLVNYSILGNVGNIDINKENPYFSKPCCTLSLVAKGGVVKNIIGYNEVCKLFPQIIDSELRYTEGDNIPKNGALRQIIMRYFIVAENIDEIKSIINTIQETVSVIDENDSDMLIAPFDVNRIKNV